MSIPAKLFVHLQVTHSRDQSRKSEEDELYSAENFRRLARSLSGTVISSREETLVSSHSFVSSNNLIGMFDNISIRETQYLPVILQTAMHKQLENVALCKNHGWI